MLVSQVEDADASGAGAMHGAGATTGETRETTSCLVKRKGESAEASPFVSLLSWVACDKCEKWRRLSEESLAQYEDKAFHCSYLPGVDCDTPEEASNDLVDGAALNSGKHSKVAICPSCRTPLERGQRGREKVSIVLERHYRVFPLCRPLEATTPVTVASLIVDLSDRLPYRAVEHEALAPPLARSLAHWRYALLFAGIRSLFCSVLYPIIRSGFDQVFGHLPTCVCAGLGYVGGLQLTREKLHKLCFCGERGAVVVQAAQVRGAQRHMGASAAER